MRSAGQDIGTGGQLRAVDPGHHVPPELPRQEAEDVGQLVRLLGDRLALAVTGAGLYRGETGGWRG